MKPPPKPEKVEAVAKALATGRSTRDVASAFGVSEATVRNWQKQHNARAAEQPEQKPPGGRFSGVAPMTYPPEPAPEYAPAAESTETAIERLQREAAARLDEPEPEEPEDADILTTLKRMLRDTLRRARESEQVGNWNSAQKAGRDAAALANTITRHERNNAADAEVLKISRTEIGERRSKVRERFRSICDRPLLCAACNRKLSVLWGTGKETIDEAAE